VLTSCSLWRFSDRFLFGKIAKMDYGYPSTPHSFYGGDSSMQYRTFGKLDWKPSALGFGAMRLPTLRGDRAQIDEPEATRMLRYAIDHGVNYVDSAYSYHGGNSERFLGRVLQDGYRGKVKLATKLPMWLVEATEDFDRYLGEQLDKLQTDHIDFYLFHGLRKERWATVRKLNLLKEAEKALADGRIRHVGFSFHDEFEVFQDIIDSYDGWTMAQIQYNYMDVNHQAGTQGLEYAAERGLAVVIMEPIRGGKLATSPPQAVLDLWESAPRERTPAEWALQWVWNHPEVSLVLSGMSTMEQVVENVASAGHSGAGALTQEELDLVDHVRETYQQLIPIPCTACEYCLPCPNGVSIPRIFEIYNEAIMYNDLRSARRAYNIWIKEEERANLCEECGTCEELCPQGISIASWLAKAHDRLGQAAAAA
jgi:predicted aldo/keto reductase-like oxidoreductase